MSTYAANGLAGFRAATTRGWFGLDPAYFYSGNRGTPQRRHRRSTSRSPTSSRTELEDFADCIINKRPTKVSGEMGLPDVKYLMAIYESIKKGRPVSLA